MSDVLNRILARKAQEVMERSQRVPLRELSQRIEGLHPTRGFRRALEARAAEGQPAIIAEIKKASPSKGLIAPQFDPEQLALDYEKGGAACLSVLTDIDFFQGGDEYLGQARRVSSLPVLRKDFMIDTWQIYESRWIGADCILLIVAALGDAALKEMATLALELDLDVLVEIHDEAELDRALNLPSQCLLGINNRNLRTFETSLSTTERLIELAPKDAFVISESGIRDRADIERLMRCGAQGFLIGETLMRAEDTAGELMTLSAPNLKRVV